MSPEALLCLLLDFRISARLLLVKLVAGLCYYLETSASELLVNVIQELVVLLCQASFRRHVHEQHALSLIIDEVTDDDVVTVDVFVFDVPN